MNIDRLLTKYDTSSSFLFIYFRFVPNRRTDEIKDIKIISFAKSCIVIYKERERKRQHNTVPRPPLFPSNRAKLESISLLSTLTRDASLIFHRHLSSPEKFSVVTLEKGLRVRRESVVVVDGKGGGGGGGGILRGGGRTHFFLPNNLSHTLPFSFHFFYFLIDSNDVWTLSLVGYYKLPTEPTNKFD